MALRSLFTALTVTLVASIAHARPLTKEERQCLFRAPVAFGASLTSAMPKTLLIYDPVVKVRGVLEGKGRGSWTGYGGSPGHQFIYEYGFMQDPLTFPIEWIPNFARLFSPNEEDWGVGQVRSFLKPPGDMYEYFKKSSMAFGIDAFYWDTIHAWCDYGHPEKYATTGAETEIARLTAAAKAQGTVLFLGTVPIEDPTTVLVKNEDFGVDFMWTPPVPECVLSVNQALRLHCKSEDGCFIVDLASMAYTLVNGGKIPLNNGETYGLYDMRPDGVHLSPYGSTHVAEEMVRLIEGAADQIKDRFLTCR